MLEGKRILITGGAGFIGTTLAKRLVEANEVVAFDNLHRNTLEGTDLATHRGFSFVTGDVLDGDALTRAARSATHIVHAAAITGIAPGKYDVKLADTKGRVCTVQNVEVVSGRPYAFSLSDKDLTSCTK